MEPWERSMPHAPAVTQTLARFAVEARWEDIPDAARHEAKRALIDAVWTSEKSSDVAGLLALTAPRA
jgi:2-methylcitrate dehydratase PrpD